MVVKWVSNMRKLLNVLFYILLISFTIYEISNYQSFDLVEMILFTVFAFMFGSIVTLDVGEFIVKHSKEKSEE